MKKSICLQCLFLSLCLLFLFCNNSCSKPEEKRTLESEIEGINKICPYSLGGIGEITSAEIDNGNLLYNISVKQGAINLETPDLHKKSMKDMLSNPNKDMKQMLELLVKENYGLCYAFTEEGTDKTMKINFTAEEIKELK